jgi:hypothetical protein
MIKVDVFYPQSKKFDWDYYINKHTPMLRKLMGLALKKVAIERIGHAWCRRGGGLTDVEIAELTEHFKKQTVANHGALSRSETGRGPRDRVRFHSAEHPPRERPGVALPPHQSDSAG